MAFILKENLTTINIKLTSYGRKQLAEGKLNFSKWAVGDSEIDYTFFDNIGFDGFNANILRPKDQNPKIVYFIKTDEDADKFTSIPSVASQTNVITNTALERGFFDTSTSPKSLKIEPTFCKQADMQINISGVTGGTSLKIKKAPSYLSNLAEPQVGDYLLVKWANPLITAGTVTNLTNAPVPYIWYKIESRTGSLNGNNLVVTVDKPLPHFNGQGGSIAAGTFLYPNSNERAVSGDSVQTYYGSPLILDFYEDAVLTFLENCNSPSIDVGVWNMAIVFTEEVAGVTSTDRNYSHYYTKSFGGFVQYVQKISPTVKNIGIIHYTNNSPSNNYGESFHEDTPVLELPTVMWHYETGNTIGLTLTCGDSGKTLTDLNTRYYDLIDPYGNIVGKVFNDLKLFVIEDQELLFAMTYKANRNWTLPALSAGLNLVLCSTDVIHTTTTTLPPIGTVWATRTSPMVMNWQSVTYGEGLFVAVGYGTTLGNTVMTSPDGITWTARSSAFNSAWGSVAYGNGMFVAVGSTGGFTQKVMTSPDGLTWTLQTAHDLQWQSVTFGNGLFVAVASADGVDTQRVMTSSDGITWTLRTAPSNGWYDVAFGNGIFVATSIFNDESMTSPDGITWTSRTLPANNSWRHVTYGGSLFVAVGGSGTGNRVMTSPDAINWTLRTSAEDNLWESVTYGDGLYVAVGGTGTNRVMISSDAITWTAISVPSERWRSVAYGNGRFVSVGLDASQIMTAP